MKVNQFSTQGNEKMSQEQNSQIAQDEHVQRELFWQYDQDDQDDQDDGISYWDEHDSYDFDR